MIPPRIVSVLAAAGYLAGDGPIRRIDGVQLTQADVVTVARTLEAWPASEQLVHTWRQAGLDVEGGELTAQECLQAIALTIGWASQDKVEGKRGRS